MASLSLSRNATRDGLRQINLSTDLAQLADLIELVFAHNMDSGGRAVIDEMRLMSRLGAGAELLAGLNGLAYGIRSGYVWMANGKLVGNVSIYPVTWPGDLGKVWAVVNVGVHPDYRRQGIAQHLMQAALEFIRQRGGTTAILQVDVDNEAAQNLYRRLGFVAERAWTTWRRGSRMPVMPPLPEERDVLLSLRSGREWQAEYDLAERVRPADQGGLGWQRPLHPRFFRNSLLQQLASLFSLQQQERLVVYDQTDYHLSASLWIESSLSATRARLTLLTEPETRKQYAAALIGNVVRRRDDRALLLEHPMDEAEIIPVLEHYRFTSLREVLHMRWDASRC